MSLRAVFAKTAWQSINLALFLLFWIATLTLLARNDGQGKLTILGYFAIAQYDKFRLSPKFFKTNEKFKEFKEFANFLKNFLLEVQKRHYVSQGCVTINLFKRKFAL